MEKIWAKKTTEIQLIYLTQNTLMDVVHLSTHIMVSEGGLQIYSAIRQKEQGHNKIKKLKRNQNKMKVKHLITMLL